MYAVLTIASAHTAQAGINVWTSHGPEGGAEITALAIDPTTPSTLYAGTYDGVSKSTDGGCHWSAINTGLTNGLAGNALVIDSVTPSTIYAGTYGGGVFKSTDAGATWAAANSGLATTNPLPNPFYVHALAIDPVTPSTLYAGTYGEGTFKSTDAGATWAAINNGLTDPSTDTSNVAAAITAFAIDPVTANTMYAAGAVARFGGAVFKSTNAGATWAPLKDFPGAFAALAIDSITPSTLYLGNFDGVFKSTDAGATWAAPLATTNPFYVPAYVAALAIDPVTPTRLYAGTYGDGVFKSTDGGRSWRALNTGLPVGSDGAGTVAPVVALAIDPVAPTTLYAGIWGGGVFDIEQVAACVGDCDASGNVTVGNLVTLVNMALGRPGACSGVSPGAPIDIAFIIEAVGNALGGCSP